jgi:hypothetical protein
MKVKKCLKCFVEDLQIKGTYKALPYLQIFKVIAVTKLAVCGSISNHTTSLATLIQEVNRLGHRNS